MARKIIYLINPISGTRGKRSLKELIRQKTDERGIAYTILPTDASGDYSHLPRLIREEGVTDIVICGGDGTVSAVAAALYDCNTQRRGDLRDVSGTGDVSHVRLGVIPMGSGNGLAFAAGIPKDPAKALELIFKGSSAPIDGFLINGQFSCMLCGIGLDGQVAHEFAGQQRRGLQTYIRITMRNFFTARAYPFRLSIPAGGKVDPASNGGLAAAGPAMLPVEAFFISVANGNQFGNNFTIAPKASLHDGLLDIVIARKTNRLIFFYSVIRQVLGRYPVETSPERHGGKKIIYFQTPALEIENPGNAPLHIDGDPKPSASSFRIAIAPNAIRLIMP